MTIIRTLPLHRSMTWMRARSIANASDRAQTARLTALLRSNARDLDLARPITSVIRSGWPAY